MIFFPSWSQTSWLESQGGLRLRLPGEASEVDVRSGTSRLLHTAMTFPHIICYHIINFTSLDLWNAAPPDIRSKCREKDSLGDL